MRAPFTLKFKKPSLLGFFCSIIFLSGCTSAPPQTSCLPNSEIKIVANIPENAINMSTGEKITAKKIESFGVFVEKNTVLSISHAFPPSTTLKKFTKKKQDEKNELLLLQSQKCGTPLNIAEKNATKNESVFWCSNAKNIGKIDEESIETFSQFPLGKTKKLTNLQKINGTFTQGDSGKGVCNTQKKMVGIIVAADDDGGLLTPVETIQKFYQTQR